MATITQNTSASHRTLYRGDGLIITNDNVTVIGNNCTVSGHNVSVYGNGHTISGNYCVVYGSGNTVAGDNCAAHGSDNYVTGQNSTLNEPIPVISSSSRRRVGTPVRNRATSRVVRDARETTAESVTSSSSGSGVDDFRFGVTSPVHFAEGDFRTNFRFGGSADPITSLVNAAVRLHNTETNGARKPIVRRIGIGRIFIPANSSPRGVTTDTSGTGDHMVVSGVHLPAGTTLHSLTVTSSGTDVGGLPESLVSNLVAKYPEEEVAASASSRESLTDTLTRMKEKDRVCSDAEETKQCRVCLDQVRCVALDTCGHTQLCVACAMQLVTDGKIECPICKKVSTRVAYSWV